MSQAQTYCNGRPDELRLVCLRIRTWLGFSFIELYSSHKKEPNFTSTLSWKSQAQTRDPFVSINTSAIDCCSEPLSLICVKKWGSYKSFKRTSPKNLFYLDLSKTCYAVKGIIHSSFCLLAKDVTLVTNLLCCNSNSTLKQRRWCKTENGEIICKG